MDGSLFFWTEPLFGIPHQGTCRDLMNPFLHNTFRVVFAGTAPISSGFEANQKDHRSHVQRGPYVDAYLSLADSLHLQVTSGGRSR